MRADRFDQLATAQAIKRGLDGALREAGRSRQRAQTRGHWFPTEARGLSVEIQINEIRGWLLIMAHDVAHEDVEDIVIDRDGFAEAGHGRIRVSESSKLRTFPRLEI